MNVNDRVRVLHQLHINESYRGKEATVVKVFDHALECGFAFHIRMDGYDVSHAFKESELELIGNKISHKLIYLAAPYSDSDPLVLEDRIHTLCRCDARLMEKGVFTVSPLLKHLLLTYTTLPGDWAYWKTYSETLLRQCDSMIVLTMFGWETSTGVQAEIKLCRGQGKPVEFIDPVTLLLNLDV
jgi:hypothetical protein